MKKKIVMILAILCFLTGCAGANSLGDLHYEDFGGVVQSSGTYADFERVEYNGITYYFKSDEYSKSKKNSTIKNVDKVIGMLIDANSTLPEGFSVYFGSNLYVQGIYGKVYFDKAFKMNRENMLVLLQGVYGEYANYGLIYGYTNYIAEQISVKTSVVYTDEELASKILGLSFKKTDGILALNLPLFENVYANDDEMKISQAIAVSFTEYLIEHYGTEKLDELLRLSYQLTTEFDVLYCEYLNNWLSNELDLSIKSEPMGQAIRFEKNMAPDKADYPYVVHSVSLKGYVHKEMKTFWYHSSVQIPFDYYKIREYFVMMEDDIADAKEYLAQWIDVETERMKLKMFMPREEAELYISMYDPLNATATVVYPASGFHEYIHHLTSRYIPERWMGEGIAVYMDIYRMDGKSSNAVEMDLWVYCANIYEQIPSNVQNLEEYQKAVDAYRILSNYKWDNKYDVEAFYERAAYMECLGYDGWGMSGFNEDIAMSYEKAGSMFYYLIQTYGEEMVFKIYKDYDVLKKELNINYYDVLIAWEEYLVQKVEGATYDGIPMG